mmetsp:Transcript_41549/g.97240  ORF Transcript_41549/g.97240 Transcript_41549/m.97240 type:complete len:238 (+) Transcript_41549:270-983(+)
MGTCTNPFVGMEKFSSRWRHPPSAWTTASNDETYGPPGGTKLPSLTYREATASDASYASATKSTTSKWATASDASTKPWEETDATSKWSKTMPSKSTKKWTPAISSVSPAYTLPPTSASIDSEKPSPKDRKSSSSDLPPPSAWPWYSWDSSPKLLTYTWPRHPTNDPFSSRSGPYPSPSIPNIGSIPTSTNSATYSSTASIPKISRPIYVPYAREEKLCAWDTSPTWANPAASSGGP